VQYSMLNKLRNQFSSQPAAHTNDTECPKCHNALELPPSLEFLRASEKAPYLTFNTTIDRSVLACRHCAYSTAKQNASEISYDRYQRAWQAIDAKVEKANELLENDDLEEDMKERLRLAKPKWADERLWLYQQGLKVEKYNELQMRITKIVDLISDGLCEEEMEKDLKKVLNENRDRSAKFEVAWQKDHWMPYWAIWGWDGELTVA